MKVFIDCEFNSHGGELISMALVAEDGQEFYEVLGCANPHPWVREHVMPFLLKNDVSRSTFVSKLWAFVSKFDHIELIADWPEDIRYFCEAIITSPGEMIPMKGFTAVYMRGLHGDSTLPHNALHDARANALAFKELKK